MLMGGASSEREISLRSGEAVASALKEEGYDVLPLDIDDNLRDIQKRLEEAHISVAFIALHGRFGEDGTIQKLLDCLNIPYTGSGAKASSLALNKIASRKIFRNAGIAVPEYRVFTPLEKATDKAGSKDVNHNCGLMPLSTHPVRKNSLTGFTSKVSIEDDNFHFPLVVKPSSQGSSIGLSIVENKEDLPLAIGLALSFDERVIVEEYISGREITVGILDDQALPVIQIVPKRRFYDYQAKYETGMSNYFIPAPLSPDEYLKAQEAGLSAHRSLGCRTFSRVDMIMSKGIPVVLEVNTIPGLTPSSLLPKAAKAAGISFNRLCVRLIELAIA